MQQPLPIPVFLILTTVSLTLPPHPVLQCSVDWLAVLIVTINTWGRLLIGQCFRLNYGGFIGISRGEWINRNCVGADVAKFNCLMKCLFLLFHRGLDGLAVD